MSVAAKKPHTEKVSIKVGNHQAEIFYLMKPVAENLLQFMRSMQPNDDETLTPIDEVFPALKDKNERVATVLRGARYKEGMTQAELAKKINITQGDLSKMEHGKRPIGKKLAQRIASILRVDYRIFL